MRILTVHATTGTVVRGDWQAIFRHVRDAVRPAGLDLAHPLSLLWLDDPAIRPEGFAHDGLGVLIGNSRALWPAMRRRLPTGAQRSDHPVDDHCVGVINQAVDEIDAELQLAFAHRRWGDGFLPIQRIAQAVGFAHLSPCHLSIHSDHGPWIALRALALFDVPGPPPPAPLAPDPCNQCDKPCLAAFDRATLLPGPVQDHWRAWLAIRDACPLGRASRYSDAQVEYHYTKQLRLFYG